MPSQLSAVKLQSYEINILCDDHTIIGGPL